MPRAFTLSELMLVLAILLVVVSGLLFAFVNCILLNESNNNLVTAVNDAQYVLEQIKGLTYSQISGFITSFNSTQFGNLDNETVNFPDPDIGTNIAKVTVNVNWTERQRNRGFSLSTHIAP